MDMPGTPMDDCVPLPLLVNAVGLALVLVLVDGLD
jgi:hypothetical protein